MGLTVFMVSDRRTIVVNKRLVNMDRVALLITALIIFGVIAFTLVRLFFT